VKTKLQKLTQIARWRIQQNSGQTQAGRHREHATATYTLLY